MIKIKKSKKALVKLWNLLTNIFAHILALVLGAAMATGQLTLSTISWLAWIQPIIVPVGWIVVVITLISAGLTLFEFFMK